MIPVIHEKIYLTIKKVSNGNITTWKKVHYSIRLYINFNRFPKNEEITIINELVAFGLLKKMNRKFFEILPCQPIKRLQFDDNPLW
jgi:hypothetical protein